MHHRKRNRLQHYDYSCAGYYFVTICTHDKINYFGSIRDGKMVRNRMGDIAYQFLQEISTHFPETELDCFIVMPNHVHGIIVIHDTVKNTSVGNASVENAYMHSLQHPHSLQQPHSLQPQINKKLPHQHRTKMLLCKIIQQYKAAVTREIRKSKLDSTFRWQKSFYDHVIRNDFSLDKVRHYIIHNPLKWEYDRENPNDISIEIKKQFWNRFWGES